MNKTCNVCGYEKSIDMFYKHPKTKDGRDSKCKECAKKRVRENRKSKVEYYREYDRKRGNRQYEGYCAEWRLKNPMKYAAQTAIGNRVRDGSIKKPEACESCGLGDYGVHGHHDDYAYPLSVRWLCPACHRAWHDKNGEAPNGR